MQLGLRKQEMHSICMEASLTAYILKTMIEKRLVDNIKIVLKQWLLAF